MSKSILIVICDFLLLSLLSLATFDTPPIEDVPAKKEAAIEQSFADSQMVDLLKMSLDSERDRRLALDSDVSKLSKAAEESRQQAERQKKIIEARERELARLAKTKADLEAERAEILKKSGSLEKRVSLTESRNEKLQQEILSASRKLEKSAQERIDLEKKLGDMRETDSTTKVKLETVQDELRQNKEYLEKLRAESDNLKNENKAIESEKHALATQLEVAATKTQIYEENIKRYQLLVDIEKSEKEKIREHAETLAVGVGELANSQEKIAKDVRELRPKTPSEIFEEIKPSFVRVVFAYSKKGILGASESTVELRALPVKIGDKTWIVFGSADTVAAPSSHAYYPPESLTVSVFGKSYRFEAPMLYSIFEDPRLLAIEVPQAFIDKEKIKAVAQPENFFAFVDCVVVNPSKFYYGQIPFRADFKNSAYAQLDVGLLQSVFGSFSPSDGDFVLSRSGDFMGCMVDSSVAILLRSMTPAMSIKLGKDYTPASASAFVAETSARLKQIPLRLK